MPFRDIHNWELEQRKDVGRCFKALREEYGLSQRDVARDLETTQNQVSKFENGLYDFKFSTLQIWAAYYGYGVIVDLEPYPEEETENVEEN